MASISKRMVGKEPRYDVNWREPDGRRRRKMFRLKDLADKFAVKVEHDKNRGAYIDPDAGKVTFKSYADQWLAAQTFDITSREAVAMHLRLHVYPTLGGKQLRSIKPSTIQAWLKGLEMSPTYARMIFGTVSSVFNAAVDDELVVRNPCRAGSVRTPKKEIRRVVPWTLERVVQVHDALPARYRVAATIAAGLGLRQGEVFGLAVEDVDFLRGTVRIRRQVRLFSGGSQAFRAPKGGGEREIPLPDSVRRELAAHLAAVPAQSVTLPWDLPDGKPTTVRLVLTAPDGSALQRNSFNRRVWAPALSRAGVPQTRDDGMHALRHYYASVLLDAGESIKAVSDYLGHADPGFTLRTYAHVMPNSTERTKLAVDQSLGRYIGGTSAPRQSHVSAGQTGGGR